MTWGGMALLGMQCQVAFVVEFWILTVPASFLASASTILIYGQLYSLYSLKTIFLLSFLLFGIGNAISASATTSAVFIVGRAITGLGCAGIFSGGSM